MLLRGWLMIGKAVLALFRIDARPVLTAPNWDPSWLKSVEASTVGTKRSSRDSMYKLRAGRHAVGRALRLSHRFQRFGLRGDAMGMILSQNGGPQRGLA